MVVVAIAIENLSYDFVREASVWSLLLYSGVVALLLFPSSLLLQKAIGSDDAGDIFDELCAKLLQKLHLKNVLKK